MEIIEGGKIIEFIFIHCTINWFNATGLGACLILKTSGMYKKIKCVIFHIEGYWIVFLDTDGKAQRNKKESCCQPQLFFYWTHNAIRTKKISFDQSALISFFQYIFLLFCWLTAEQPAQNSATCFSSQLQITTLKFGIHSIFFLNTLTRSWVYQGLLSPLSIQWNSKLEMYGIKVCLCFTHMRPAFPWYLVWLHYSVCKPKQLEWTLLFITLTQRGDGSSWIQQRLSLGHLTISRPVFSYGPQGVRAKATLPVIESCSNPSWVSHENH